jgi:hypothetical protein
MAAGAMARMTMNVNSTIKRFFITVSFVNVPRPRTRICDVIMESYL